MHHWSPAVFDVRSVNRAPHGREKSRRRSHDAKATSRSGRTISARTAPPSTATPTTTSMGRGASELPLRCTHSRRRRVTTGICAFLPSTAASYRDSIPQRQTIPPGSSGSLAPEEAPKSKSAGRHRPRKGRKTVRPKEAVKVKGVRTRSFARKVLATWPPGQFGP